MERKEEELKMLLDHQKLILSMQLQAVRNAHFPTMAPMNPPPSHLHLSHPPPPPPPPPPAIATGFVSAQPLRSRLSTSHPAQVINIPTQTIPTLQEFAKKTTSAQTEGLRAERSSFFPPSPSYFHQTIEPFPTYETEGNLVQSRPPTAQNTILFKGNSDEPRKR